MFIWFVVASILIVATVFQSGATDYRFVVIGSVLPLIEAPIGPGPLHSMIGATAVLVVVLCVRGRILRRQLLGIPIGVMCHLVLDGAWNQASVFWWPLAGTSPSVIPEVNHWGLSLLLELGGLALGVFAYKRFDLHNETNRQRFLKTGRLSM